ncbi:MAG: asparaginase [Candidatus Thermoplasmatota archaeon]|nr:asparaginase [Candidatus Thermoplasmatota archaeon]
MRSDDIRRSKSEPGLHIVIEDRGGIVEALHHVHAAVVDSSGRLIASSGDPNHYTFTRSCLKPIQAIPILEHGVHEAYGLTNEEIAIIAGSHSGEPDHIRTVRSILNKSGIDEAMLGCGGHEPFHKPTNFEIGGKFSPIHDNCSGKHAGSLALTKYMGWDLGTYLDPSHPAQKAVLEVACSLGNMEPENVTIAPDGCSIPNLAYPIRNLALQFARIADPGSHTLKEECQVVFDSMMGNPYMVSGTGRFDKDLMEDHPHRLLAKAGAVGLQALAANINGRWLGIAIKIEDGSHPALTTATYHILDELLIRIGESMGEKYRDQTVKTRSGEVVGAIRCSGELLVN